MNARQLGSSMALVRTTGAAPKRNKKASSNPRLFYWKKFVAKTPP